jgi:hypothetical protein
MTFRSYAAGLVGLVAVLGFAGPREAPAKAASRWQSVSFDGVSLRVPASWPVIDFGKHPSACPRLDVHAVYLGTPGPDPSCPAGLVGKTEAVMVQPLRRGSPDDRTARMPVRPAMHAGARRAAGGQVMLTNRNWAVSRTITDVLPNAGIEVAISYRTGRALALAIQSSITVAGTRAAPQSTSARRMGAARRAGHADEARRSQARSALQAVFVGRGFDSCAAPSAATMAKWLASSYRAVGVYIGGVNRACAQVNLTASWLAGIEAQGWRYFPIYPGPQSSCVQASGDATISSSKAASEGTAAADDAVSQAAALGIPKGTPVIYDMEAYGPACNTQVINFLSAWDSELHARGYTSGVYESFTNIGALVSAAGKMTEPDVIYYADWDGQATTTSSYMPAAMWTSHQRLHQYQGGHLETYGGATIDIDSDQLDVNLAGTSTPPPPPPGNGGFRISVAVNSNGTAEWFAKSAGGALVHAWQQPVGSLTWSAMHTVGNSPTTMASNPAVTAQANGGLTVVARDSAGQLEHGWQQAGYPNDWEWGAPLATPVRPPLAGTDPAAVLLPGGRVEVYQTTSTGGVATIRQVSPNDNARWTAWGRIKGSCASSPAPIADSGHDVDVFSVTTSGTAAVDTWNGSSWSGWTTLGGSPADLAGVPAVAVNGSGQTEFFAATTSGGLADAWQNGVDGAWSWGSPLAGAGTTIAGSPAAATWPTGQLVVYAKLASGEVGYIHQTGSAGTASWGNWASIGGLAGAAQGSPAGWLNTSGAAGVAVLDGNSKLAVSSNSTAGGNGSGWAAWSEVGSGF